MCKSAMLSNRFISLHESLLGVSAVLNGLNITVGFICEMCQFIPVYFAYTASFAQPLDASESKAMNPIENHKWKLFKKENQLILWT